MTLHTSSEPAHGVVIPCVCLCVLLFFDALPFATAQIETVPAPPPPPSEPYSPVGPRFNPSMAIVMVVLVSVFFCMGFFSVYLRQCAERRMGGGNYDANLNFGRRSRRCARGLDPSVIESFPTFLYSDVRGHKIGKAALECAVCLNEFEDDETLRLIPKCSHGFHPDCIDAWLSSHSTCPVCRANLAPKPGEILPCAAVQIFDPDIEADNRPENNDGNNETSCTIGENHRRDSIESVDVNMIIPNVVTSENRPPRSRSTGWRLTALFPRSHSTGHSLIQRGEDLERFTLRLPEEVRRELMNTSLNRTKSCVAFPRATSARRGYRSRSGGRSYFYYERFDRETRSDGWGFPLSVTPPFFNRAGSSRSQKVTDHEEPAAGPPKGFLKSIRSPLDRLFVGGEDTVGERSLDRLRPDTQV